MSVWAALTGLFRPARELVEAFKPNAERSAEREHVERLTLNQQDMASLEQFAAEFQSTRTSTAWDSFIDGLNRLPRPLITLGILGLFVLAPADPVRFLEIARAYQLMPDGFWALLSLIIAFYFGGRMQVTRQQMKVTGDTLDAAKDMVQVRKALRSLAADAGAKKEDEPAPLPSVPDAKAAARLPSSGNRVVAAWLRRRADRAETLSP